MSKPRLQQHHRRDGGVHAAAHGEENFVTTTVSRHNRIVAQNISGVSGEEFDKDGPDDSTIMQLMPVGADNRRCRLRTI